MNTKWFASLAAAVSSSLGRSTPLISHLRPIYTRALDFLYAESGMEVRVGNETLNVCSRVRNFAQVESDVYTYLHSNIRAGSTILDVGSYLGVYAMLSARLAGRTGQVLAFEPTTTSLPFLHKHLVMNNLQDCVRVLACAVGRHSGVVEFYEHAEAYLNSVGSKDSNVPANLAIRVPMISIDEACAMFDLQPDFVRIDVQGLEGEVLQGAAQTIKNCPHLKIIIEVHPQLWSQHDLNEEKFKTQLSELSLVASTLDGKPPVYFPDAHLVLQPISKTHR